jgi:acrylyl-CoA reductase (NADPH)/3-hydroxypropionyl-CoA dehydratase/3-hydroxypropionyl-CoA synthetase
VRRFSDRTLKPVGSAVAPLLRNTLDRRGLPDVVFERAGRDGLGLATSLVKPNTGKVVYAEDLSGRRSVLLRAAGVDAPAPYPHADRRDSRHAPEHGAGVRGDAGTYRRRHDRRDAAGDRSPARRSPRHTRPCGKTATPVRTTSPRTACPRSGLKTRDELYRAWAIREAEKRGETLAHIDTGSAGALR